MKNKSSLMIIGIFALVLVLGVGYAVISAVDMTITGSASAQSEDLAVKFSAVTTSNNSKVDAKINADTLTGTVTVSSLGLNESQTVTYTIQNNETDVNASVIESTLTNSNPEYFEVTSDISTAKTVDAGGTITVKLTIKLIKTPVVEANNSTNITLKLKASPLNNVTT